MDHPSLLLPYEETRDILKSLQDIIPVEPRIKITEDDVIVGIITNTNQFVPILVSDNIIPQDELELQEGIDYLVSDKNVVHSNDEMRNTQIRKIKLEHNFKHAYRKTVKHILHHRDNIHLLDKIKDVLTNKEYFYKDKAREIENIIQPKIKDYITFVDEIKMTDEPNICYNSSLNECEKQPYCFVSDNDRCKIYLPKKNILSNTDNETQYMKQLVYDMIHHENVQQFLFVKNKYVVHRDIKYQQHKDEQIVMDSDLYSLFRYKTDQQREMNVPVPDMVVPMFGKKYSNSFRTKRNTNENKEHKEIKQEKQYI